MNDEQRPFPKIIVREETPCDLGDLVVLCGDNDDLVLEFRKSLGPCRDVVGQFVPFARPDSPRQRTSDLAFSYDCDAFQAVFVGRVIFGSKIR